MQREVERFVSALYYYAKKDASAALANIGPDAVSVIVDSVGRLETDQGWTELASVLRAMGSEAIRALEESSERWTEDSTPRLERLLAALGAVPGTPALDADVDARVRTILTNFQGAKSYTTPNEHVPQLVAMGRA